MHRVHFQFYIIWTRTCQEGAPAEVLDSGKDLKVVEHLGDRTMQRKGTEEDIISEEFCRALPGGH
jgi:hypothetical protein